MKLNRKAQNITNGYVLVLIIVIITLFSTVFINFGGDLLTNPNNILEEDSINYIYDRSGFDPDVSITDNTTTQFFSTEGDSEGSAKDFTLEFQFYREQSSGIREILQNIWNIPTFFVDGLGLNRDDWKVPLNILNTLIWVIIFYGMYRLIRGIFN